MLANGCTEWPDLLPGCPVSGGPCRCTDASDAADAVPRNSLHTCACARLTESYVKLCPQRQTVFIGLVGRFLQSRWRIGYNPAAALSFLAWPFFVWSGANLRTQYAPRFALPAVSHDPVPALADWAFGPLARTAGCEPQTLQTLFSGRTVAQCCAGASRIGLSPGRTPVTWGMVACAGHNNRP